MTRKQRRLTMIGGAGVVLAIAAALVLVALRDQIVFFYSPTELSEKALAPGTRVRIGGLVAEDSVIRGSDGGVSFLVDTIGDVLEVPRTAFEDPPSTMKANLARMVSAVCKLPNRLLLVLAPERALPQNESIELSARSAVVLH